ncbi:MAG: mechanosensitive ion channel [Acidobacteriota bacterium]
MYETLHWLQARAAALSEFERKLLASAVLLFLFWAIRFVALRIVHRRVESPRALYQWRKGLTYSTWVLAILFVGRIWFRGFEDLSTFLGLLSAGLAIALQDPIVNLVGWMFLVVRQPFRVGDRIEIGGLRGDVIDIRLFQFSVLEIGNWVDADQSTGRVVHVPNGRVFREPQANFTEGFPYIWNELAVLVTFESNWREAKRLLQEIADAHAASIRDEVAERVRQAARRYMIYYRHLTPTVYTSVADSGVNLTVRYLCEARRRRSTAEALWEAILDAFSRRDDIDFAYPTYRIYRNPEEGKPAAGGPARTPDLAGPGPGQEPSST